ncbi:SDR family NAD(P)-dependent oxidoreductase [Streptomyces sp. NPDC051211]|uniref:SDR family NAD(P)-dependent oxidoreductase n=1 Tax=Streptomyces sp. NPDC051211 TaxID=3154643 RepID=UPI00344EDFB1
MTAPELLGDEALAALTAAAKDVPGVFDAVAVARKVRASEPAAAQPAPAAAPGPAPVRQPDPAPVADTAPAAADELPAGPAADLYGGDLIVPAGAPATLQEALRAAAEQAPGKGTVYLRAGEEDVFQTYAELLASAERVLAGFRAAGLKPGDAALFVFDDNRGYLTAFWACVLGGFVPTPVAVATSYTTPNEVNRKLLGAWNLLGRPVLVTDAATAGALAGVRELWNEPDVRILTAEDLAGHEPDHDWFPATADSPVLNLLTSGSTGVPKCVQHTNASVVARSHSVIRHCGLTSEDVSLIWMPFDHVTVAYYNVRDVFLQCMHVNAKINHFLADPLQWLDWIERYRATNVWAPNFAFALINERADEIRAGSWDLSSLREISDAGEPVVAATSHRFLELLAPHGLPADAIVPCWGMSETCSGVTYTRQSREDRTAGTVAIDPASLQGNVRHLDPGHEDAVVLSRVGRPIPGVRIRIVDDNGAVLPEGRMGELAITGPTIMRGYFANEEANREAYDSEGWFRTGDLAFVHDGEVVIAGRKKDQIIVRGINYMAHELESVVERVDGVRVTFSAAVGVREPGAGSDDLAVFFVPTGWDADTLDRTAAEVRAILVREAGVSPDLIIPVTEAEFPKTGSGKVQRAALVTALRAGAFADRLAAASGSAAEEEGEDTWLFGRQWVQLPEPAAATAAAAPAAPENADSAAAAASGVTLALGADLDVKWLDLQGQVVAARRGAVYAEDGPDRYRVRATDRTDLRRLLTEVTSRHGEIGTVVLTLPVMSRSGAAADRLAAATEEFTALVSVLADGEFGRPLLLVVTSGAVYVQQGDTVDLGSCALPGLVRTAVSEAAPLAVRQLDLTPCPIDWAAAVRTELADRTRTGVVASRDGKRWQPKLVPVPEDEGAGLASQPVVPGGLYLITGGLGGIAHDIAGYLVASFGIRLLLVGRSPAEGEKAARLAELSGLGQVAYEQLDVADEDALEAAVAAAEARWGRPLDGVLHLAAADPTGQWSELEKHTLARETRETFDRQYGAKVAGTLAVAKALESRPNASLVLFGSVNGEFGGHSFGAYSAANSFLVGFADHWRHERKRTVHCLAWSMWTGVGMNKSQSSAAAEHRGFRSIDQESGLRLFLDAVASDHHYLVVGLDLKNPSIVEELVPQTLRVSEILIAYISDVTDQDSVRAAIAESVQSSSVPVRIVAVPRIPRDAYGAVDAAQLLHDAAADKPSRTYTAPATELERNLALIWSDALNRPEVGRDDSFFELGGNSLRATRLLALVDNKLGFRVTTQELYELPTVAGMAAIINEKRAD